MNQHELDTSFYQSFQDGHLEEMARFVKMGANVCYHQYDQHPVLQELILQKQDLRYIDLLVKHGADIHFENKAICLASQAGYLEAVIYFKKQGAQINDDIHNGDNSPLLLAVGSNHIPVIQYLLEEGADPNVSSCFLLNVAVNNGYYEALELLEKYGGNLFYDKNLSKHRSLLQFALISYSKTDNAIPIFKYLVEKGLDIFQHDNACLKLISKKGIVPLLDYLVVEKGISVELFSSFEKNEQTISWIENYYLRQELISSLKNIHTTISKLKL